MSNKEKLNGLRDVVRIVTAEKNKRYYADLNVGDIVYTIHNKTICQAKILEIATMLTVEGMIKTAHSDVRFKVVLPDGTILFRDFGASHYSDTNKPVYLYPSVEAARLDKPFGCDIDTNIKQNALIGNYLYNNYGGVRYYEGGFAFYKRGANPSPTRYHHCYYEHDGEDLIWERSSVKVENQNFPCGTIEELREEHIYTTYEDAYYAFQPKVVCFPTEDIEPARKPKKRITIEIELDHEDDVAICEFEGLAGEYNAKISVKNI